MKSPIFFPTVEHVQQLAYLDSICYPHCSLSLKQWEKYLKKKIGVAVVGGSVANPLGYAYAELNDQTLELLRIGTAPTYRFQGVGRLLAEVIGCTLPTLITIPETDAAGLAFLKAVGFRAVELQRAAFATCDGIRLRRPPEKNLVRGLTGG